MQLVFATTNPNKLREMTELLGPSGVRVMGLGELGSIDEPVENEVSFEGNARLKARYYAKALQMLCLSDDSGLEVAALGGAPGVHSAYYAGVGTTREERDRANNEKLLRDLRDVDPAGRGARLVCALCLADEKGEILFESRGTMEGVIVDEPAGGHGFGYDTHLLLTDVGKRAAELEPAERNARSHRGRATAELVRWLEARVR